MRSYIKGQKPKPLFSTDSERERLAKELGIGSGQNVLASIAAQNVSNLIKQSRQRARYSDEVKEEVRQLYPLCRTTADKEKLAKELGIGSVAKLYNLSSRLGAVA